MILGCISGLVLVDSRYGGRRCQLLVASMLMGPPLMLASLALSLQWPGIITMITVTCFMVKLLNLTTKIVASESVYGFQTNNFMFRHLKLFIVLFPPNSI